jgi:hypothetical protein
VMAELGPPLHLSSDLTVVAVALYLRAGISGR